MAGPGADAVPSKTSSRVGQGPQALTNGIPENIMQLITSHAKRLVLTAVVITSVCVAPKPFTLAAQKSNSAAPSPSVTVTKEAQSL